MDARPPLPCPTLQFNYGDETITVERVARSPASRILIKVHPDCRVVVAAPVAADAATVLHALKKCSRWIYTQLRTFRQQLAYITPRQYISGESHYYLGKQYLLKVIVAPVALPSVKLLRGRLEVTSPSPNAETVKALLIAWYKTRAKAVFSQRLDALLEQTLWVTTQPPLRIAPMQTQWGSCSPQGLITLNPHLVKASRECIDYVILHELCHLAEHNHSERFYRLLHQVMPTWEQTKTRLDNMASSFITT